MSSKISMALKLKFALYIYNVFIMLLALSDARECLLTGNDILNPEADCTSLNIGHNSRDSDILVSDLSYLSGRIIWISFMSTGITVLPDLTMIATSVERLYLQGNYKLTSLPPEIMSQFQALEILYLKNNPLLVVLPDVPLPNLHTLSLLNSAYTSLMNIPQMGKTIKVSASCIISD